MKRANGTLSIRVEKGNDTESYNSTVYHAFFAYCVRIRIFIQIKETTGVFCNAQNT